MLLDTETEVSGLGEVSENQLPFGRSSWASFPPRSSSENFLPPTTMFHHASSPSRQNKDTPLRRPSPRSAMPIPISPIRRAKNRNVHSPLPQLVLLDLQRSLQNLLSLRSSDGDVNGDLLVSSDREGSDGVSGLGGDGGLTGKLLEDLGGSGKSVTGFTDGDVCWGRSRCSEVRGDVAKGRG